MITQASPNNTPLLNKDFAKENPCRILIAEDNLLNQKLLVKILDKLGYEVEIAENGVEALEIVKQKKFDILFMDLQMPIMDGLEATVRILDEVGLEQQPSIIAVTANVSRNIREECLMIGMKDYIAKPIDINKIAKALLEYR